MEAWLRVWHVAAKLMGTPGLAALEVALRTDDARLIQGATCSPPPLQSVLDWPVEAADLFAFAAWQGDGLETVAEVEEYFARMCFNIDHEMGEPAGCRWLLNWYDDVPRSEMLTKLLPEVQLCLRERAASGDDEAFVTVISIDRAMGADVMVSF